LPSGEMRGSYGPPMLRLEAEPGEPMPATGLLSMRPRRSRRTSLPYRSAPMMPLSACDGDEYPPSVVSR
jgi:hypothetical protein